jgi:hypothetical protein
VTRSAPRNAGCQRNPKKGGIHRNDENPCLTRTGHAVIDTLAPGTVTWLMQFDGDGLRGLGAQNPKRGLGCDLLKREGNGWR